VDCEVVWLEGRNGSGRDSSVVSGTCATYLGIRGIVHFFVGAYVSSHCHLLLWESSSRMGLSLSDEQGSRSASVGLSDRMILLDASNSAPTHR